MALNTHVSAFCQLTLDNRPPVSASLPNFSRVKNAQPYMHTQSLLALRQGQVASDPFK